MALDPTRNDEDFVVPINRSGRECPIDRKPVSKVCHKCELWQAQELTVGGKTVVQWRCGLVWPAVVGVVNSHISEGIRAHTADVRNELAEFRSGVNKMLDTMASLARMQAVIEERTRNATALPPGEGHSPPRLEGDRPTGDGEGPDPVRLLPSPERPV